MMLSIEDAVRAIRKSMSTEPWDPKFDIISVRLMELRGRKVWGATVDAPSDPDAPDVGVSVDCETGEVEWH
jgi:hypothetical protein